MRSLLIQDELYICAMATQLSTPAMPVDRISELATELRESILFELVPIQILEVQLVSKRFKATIKRSKKLQDKIKFLNANLPPTNTGRARVCFNPAIFSAPSNLKNKNMGSKLKGLNWFNGTVSIEGHKLIGVVEEGPMFGKHSTCNNMALFTTPPGQTEVQFKISCSATASVEFSLYYGPGEVVTLENATAPIDRFQHAVQPHNNGPKDWAGIVRFVFPEGTRVGIVGDHVYGSSVDASYVDNDNDYDGAFDDW